MTSVFVLGEDVGVKGGVFGTTKGLFEAVRRIPGPGYAAVGIRHRRRGHRRRDVRHAADRGDAIFRLHAAGNESDHQRGGQNPLPLQ